MDYKAIVRVGTLIITVYAVTMIAVRAPELVSHSCFFVAITDHFKSGLANRNAIFTNGVGIPILEIQTSSFIEVEYIRVRPH